MTDPLHMSPETLKVEHTRKTYYLNKHLLDRQNCWLNLEDLIKTHKEKLDIFDLMDKTDDRNELRELAGQVQDKEFELQRLWKFSIDAKFHEWYLVPKCTCPKMDNADARGTKYSIFSSDCPIHR